VPKRTVFEKVDKHLSLNELVDDVFPRIRMLLERNRKIFRQKGILTIGNIANTNQAVTGSGIVKSSDVRDSDDWHSRKANESSAAAES
jgi:hypothetical protein